MGYTDFHPLSPANKWNEDKLFSIIGIKQQSDRAFYETRAWIQHEETWCMATFRMEKID